MTDEARARERAHALLVRVRACAANPHLALANTVESTQVVVIAAAIEEARREGATSALVLESQNAMYRGGWESGMRNAANIADCYTNGRDAAQGISSTLERKRAEWGEARAQGKDTP